jgi:hypothetical protein
MVIEPYKNNNVILTCGPGEWNFTLLSGIPGTKKWEGRQLIFRPIGSAIEYVLQNWPEADWKDPAKDRWIEIKMQEENSRADKQSDLTDLSGYVFHTVPYDHQRKSFVLARDRHAWAHFHEQGTGKSKIVIDTVAYLFEKKMIDNFIIVAKNGVHHNWIINEIPIHLPVRVPRTLAFYTAGKDKNVAPKTRPGKLHCMAFAIESFASERAQELLADWLRAGRSFIVVDESSKIKNPKAQRTKFLIKVAELATFRRIMTGTPRTTGIGAENLYSQFRFLDPDILGHRSYYTFINEYCIRGGFEGRQIIGAQNTEKLQKIMDGWSDRVLKADCLDLPPKIYKRLPFELSPQQRKLYDSYRREAILELEAMMRDFREKDGLYHLPDVVAMKAKELAITKALRLQQIACGFLPGTSERVPGPQPRLSILYEQMEDFGKKLIIWARFRKDLIDISEKWGSKAVPYFGGVDEKQRIRAMQTFQDSDKVQFFVASQPAAAYGLTLTAAGGATYHSNTSSLDLRLQSEDRCHRIGTIEPPVYTDMEAIRTVDQKIIRTLRKQFDLSRELFKDPRVLFMEEETEAE